MSRAFTSEEWVEEIAGAAEEHLDNFSVNHQSRRALEDIFDEVYHLAGVEATETLGEAVLYRIELGQHPKSSRVKSMARDLVRNEHDVELSATSSLV